MSPPGTDAPFVAVCAVGEVREGEARAFESGGRRFVLCNAGGRLYAVAERCTHAAWSLAGSDVVGCEIVCGLHGGRFDLRTGDATATPASKPLRTFGVRIADGRVEVQVPPPAS